MMDGNTAWWSNHKRRLFSQKKENDLFFLNASTDSMYPRMTTHDITHDFLSNICDVITLTKHVHVFFAHLLIILVQNESILSKWHGRHSLHLRCDPLPLLVRTATITFQSC